MARVELKNLRKEWLGATAAVAGVDLAIEDGAFVAVLGPSGCGKTTTLMMLAGIYQPTSGEITFDGARVNDVEARGRNVGIVFQSYALYPNMSVLDNIMFPLRFKTIERADAERRAREIAALVRVDVLLDRRPSQLSGGQQQRVALARALVKRPHLLLLDEPLSNLDAGLRLTMRTEIRRIQRELGVTTILVTHDQIEATTMADRVVVMNGGRVEQEGAADDLYERPDTLFVASFIGSPPINLFDGNADSSVLNVHEARIPLAESVRGGPVVLGIRPESLQVGDGGTPARVTAAEPMGREVLYTADSSLGVIRFLEAGAEPRHREGDNVSLGFSPESALIFDKASGRRLDVRIAA
ncbi:MAG: ABC transporter ATP-binding protein [Betaproteobacteria bacterium]|nr:MAG: ABC transporter ATP-binding protein [Betaproteobacteria bacterium]TMH02401.1 MAG: ABC transporter ATP-binding protein [Betaproteobacteria bacterium]